MQIPILKGIYRKTQPDLAVSYPVNMMPVAQESGISKGYLRSARGIRQVASTGKDRGGYLYLGTQYRVLGNTLYRVSEIGTMTAIGAVGQGGRVQFAESFDRLAINSGNNLYYLRNEGITRIADPDLGAVLSVAWIDGYFVTTDGEYLVVTELNDPTSVDPEKYGSSEASPDPVIGLLTLRGELYAINRYTIEVFYNAGTTGFPFARQRGAQINAGAVGRYAYAMLGETFAFVGSKRDEQPSVMAAGPGVANTISPRELDDELAVLTADQLAEIEVETTNIGGRSELLVHLPNKTWVYAASESERLQTPVWYCLAGGSAADRAYPARNHLYAYGKWWCGSATAIGIVDDTITSQFGEAPGYEFHTPLIYNDGSGALIHELELVTIGGTTAVGGGASIFCSWSDDGLTFQQERTARLGRNGARDARTVFRRIGRMRNWRTFRFRGIADAPRSFPRLEAQIEGLA